MRHSKSSWENLNLSDHDRPLNERGQKDAPVMYQELINNNWLPDTVFLSSSKRTIETLALMNFDKSITKIEIKPSIYHASIGELINQLQLIEENKTTMILGHNPGCELLVNQLTGKWYRMPTSAVALFIKQKKSWIMQDILRPKEL